MVGHIMRAGVVEAVGVASGFRGGGLVVISRGGDGKWTAEDFVASGGIKQVAFQADFISGKVAWQWENEIVEAEGDDALHTEFRGDEDAVIRGDAEVQCADDVTVMGEMERGELVLRGERAIGADCVGIDKTAVAVRNIKPPMVGRYSKSRDVGKVVGNDFFLSVLFQDDLSAFECVETVVRGFC